MKKRTQNILEVNFLNLIRMQHVRNLTSQLFSSLMQYYWNYECSIGSSIRRSSLEMASEFFAQTDELVLNLLGEIRRNKIFRQTTERKSQQKDRVNPQQMKEYPQSWTVFFVSKSWISLSDTRCWRLTDASIHWNKKSNFRFKIQIRSQVYIFFFIECNSIWYLSISQEPTQLQSFSFVRNISSAFSKHLESVNPHILVDWFLIM